jgi:hypothetical protein
MPLTDELGQEALAAIEGHGYRDGISIDFGPPLTFESWLSLLSDDQPQLTAAENRENKALFERLREAIANILWEAQFSAIARPAPSWLYELMSVLHRERATVITFNYDLIVEAAISSGSLWDPYSSRLVGAHDALQGLPPLPNTGSWLVGELGTTLKLLKLHGSLDWWAVPDDVSGATLAREATVWRFERPSELTDEGRRQQLPGRDRFIIPPLSSKSVYYRNPLTRELWQQAFIALRGADRVSIVGYSLPPADTVMANMLRVALAGRDVAIDVVNPEPDDVRTRLVGFGVSEDQIVTVASAECVERFTQQLCEEASSNLADQLRGGLLEDSPSSCVGVAWGDPGPGGSAIFGVADVSVRDGTTLVLALADGALPGGGSDVRLDLNRVASSSGVKTASELLPAIRTCTRVVAESAEGLHILVSANLEGQVVGRDARWLMFVPADPGTVQPSRHG